MLCQVWSLVWVVREIHQSLSVHTLGCSAPNIEAACKQIHTYTSRLLPHTEYSSPPSLNVSLLLLLLAYLVTQIAAAAAPKAMLSAQPLPS
jgi:hypothetical protein